MPKANKNNKSALGYSALLSSVCLSLLQANPLSWDPATVTTLTIVSPLIITTIVALSYWGFVLLDGKTSAQIIVERSFEQQIELLEKKIKEFPDDLDYRKELKRTVLARSKLYTQQQQHS